MGRAGAVEQATSLETIELELVKLRRHLETFGRRSSVYARVDRAGYLALRTLDALGPASVNTLAHWLHLDASTVTRQVATLEANGLTSRHVDPTDRRSWTISVTSAGRRTMHEVERARRDAVAKMLADWNDQEIVDLARVLSKLNVTLAERAEADRGSAGSD